MRASSTKTAFPSAIPLTNAAMNRLSELHGGYKQAYAYATREMAPGKPDASEPQRLEQRIAIINDLHIGPGFDPVMRKYDPSDDFTAVQERQFVSFFANEWAAAGIGNANLSHPTRQHIAQVLSKLTLPNGKPLKIDDVDATGKYALTVNINGDFIDFLQTTRSRPHLPFPDGRNADGAPKNTPANAIAIMHTIREGHPEIFRTLAIHLALGHRIDLIPGNHDRHLWNDHVWSGEAEVGGRTLGGFTKILAEEMKGIGLDAAQTKEALGRLERKAFAVYGDRLVDHGDMADSFNRVRRPYGEALEPSDLHSEMEMAYGDYGVRNGFNKFEPIDPSLDAIDDGKLFFKHILRHPRKTLGLVEGFLRAAAAEGRCATREADQAQRLRDLDALVDANPYILEQLNAFRDAGDKLTVSEVKDGLKEIEKRSATPFFSNFRANQGFLVRALKLACLKITGRVDPRNKSAVNVDRGLAAQKAFGISGIVEGHTHKARFDTYLTSEEKGFTRINTHTWMSKEGEWGRPGATWGLDGRGVGVIEIGTNKDGKRWVDARLEKVVDESGGAVRGDLYAEPEVGALSPKTIRAQVEQVYANNAGRALAGSGPQHSLVAA